MDMLRIVKIGGNIIDDRLALEVFIAEFSALAGPKILVHGGGKEASRLAQKLSVPVALIDGRRVTDAATLDIISMVYAGKINKSLVAGLQAEGCNAIGFTGADGNTIVAEKRSPNPVDFGFAGDVTGVNIEPLKLLMDAAITPVFCAMTHDKKGQLLNTNADTIAAELAAAFASQFNTQLLYCFEKSGVMKDIGNEESLITKIDSDFYRELIRQNIIADGMLPKLENCFYALHAGVQMVAIGRSHELLQNTQKYTSITL